MNIFSTLNLSTAVNGAAIHIFHRLIFIIFEVFFSSSFFRANGNRQQLWVNVCRRLCSRDNNNTNLTVLRMAGSRFVHWKFDSNGE